VILFVSAGVSPVFWTNSHIKYEEKQLVEMNESYIKTQRYSVWMNFTYRHTV